jgi:hypothetical protein
VTAVAKTIQKSQTSACNRKALATATQGKPATAVTPTIAVMLTIAMMLARAVTLEPQGHLQLLMSFVQIHEKIF